MKRERSREDMDGARLKTNEERKVKPYLGDAYDRATKTTLTKGIIILSDLKIDR